MREIDMSTKYDPKEVEPGRYEKWVKDGVFKPSGDKKAKPYSIVIPPPNVTGKLHLGHAWDNTLQDMLIRQKRMQGYDTLWVPGTDHAGIATQAKVEAQLREEGVTRTTLAVKSLWKRFGIGFTNTVTLSTNNGQRWESLLIMTANGLL